jgi:hypothetical protein
MSKKDLLKEELNRIQKMMGINEALLMEQPIPMPKSLIKNILKSSDDVAEPLLKIFNLTDNQIDNVINQIDRVGIDNLSDDVLEALARNSIDNVDELARLLKAGKYLGTNFDEIAIKIFDRVESMTQISPEVRKKVIDVYKKKLDEIPFLENSDEIKQKLVRDFQTEFDTKFSDRMVREAGESLGKTLDEILSTNPLDDIPEGSISNNLRSSIDRNVKGYKSFISSARKKGSFLQDITKEEYDKIMQDLMSSAKRVDRDILEEMKIIMKKDPSWWSKKPLWAKILFVMGAVGFGDVAVTTLLWSLKTKYSKFKNPVELWNWLNKTTGLDEGVDKLKESNVEGWFKVTYPAKYVDSGTFKNNFSITLNATQTEAVIEANDGSEEWEVKIQDNKIVQK